MEIISWRCFLPVACREVWTGNAGRCQCRDSTSDTLEWALSELLRAQPGGSVKAGSGNPAIKGAAAGTSLNCIGSFITTNKTFISFISLIYSQWFKPLVCVRTLEGITAVHLKRTFPLAIPWQSSNTQDSILKSQHKEPTCLWVSLLKFDLRA